MSLNLVSSNGPERKEAALSYAARGWAVLPIFPALGSACGCGDPDCVSPGKHPLRALVYNGLLSASIFAPQIATWWQQHPEANIGIRTGRASNLVVIDIDDKPDRGRDGMASWRRLVALNAEGREPETIEALTGSGGRHLYFQAPQDLLVTSSKDYLGPGLDVRAENGYVLAPPSSHVSGREYVWESASHPDDVDVMPLPPWLLSLMRTRLPQTVGDTALRVDAVIDPIERLELASALATLPADERDLWVQVGMALHSTNDNDAGYDLWNTWSQTSAKYQEADQRRVWTSFRGRSDGITTATIFRHAILYGWQRPPLEVLAKASGIELPHIEIPRIEVPAVVAPSAVVHRHVTPENGDPFLASLPGVLEEIAGWSLATAPHPVRRYSAAAAVALGSVLGARRYVTDARNYTSLYLLVAGKSGTGKEHVRRTVEQVLLASGAASLIGPGRWTSSSAVFAGLLQAPQQIAVVDEFGQFLATAQGKGESASRQDTLLTYLMELYGQLGDRIQSPQYATLSMAPSQADAAKRKVIDRPAQSLLGLTTPGAFYGALRSAQVANGFLNRFCVLEVDVARGDYSVPSADPVPGGVIAWVERLLASSGNLDMVTRTTQIPDPQLIPIASNAHVLFRAWRRDCNHWADLLEAQALGELPMRAAEQAMRLGLIAALATDSKAVEREHAAWGVEVSRHLLEHLIPTVQDQVADSPLAALRNRFLAEVRGTGPRGLSEKDLKRLPLFRGVARRDRDEVVAWTLETHQAEWGIRTHTGAGRPTRVLQFVSIMTSEEAA